MKLINKIKLTICIALIIMVFTGCKANITPGQQETNKPLKTNASSENISRTISQDVFIDEPEMSRIEFGTCDINTLNFGAKYYFDEKKLVWSNDFEKEEVITEQIDDETAEKFEEAIKKANLISWKDTYFYKEDETTMYDGKWIIYVYYKDGTSKEIAGGGIKPKKGKLFEDAISIIWGGWSWL